MPILSDHRRKLFAVKVNKRITAEYKDEAQLQRASSNPDPNFKTTRETFDLKDPLPYEYLLQGKTIRLKDIVGMNILQTLHEDSVFIDFLKYLDQLITDKDNKVNLDKVDKLKKRIKIAFDLLKEFIDQLCFFNLDEKFNNAIQLIKNTIKGKRGQRISQHFEQIQNVVQEAPRLKLYVECD